MGGALMTLRHISNNIKELKEIIKFLSYEAMVLIFIDRSLNAP